MMMQCGYDMERRWHRIIILSATISPINHIPLILSPSRPSIDHISSPNRLISHIMSPPYHLPPYHRPSIPSPLNIMSPPYHLPSISSALHTIAPYIPSPIHITSPPYHWPSIPSPPPPYHHPSISSSPMNIVLFSPSHLPSICISLFNLLR